MSGLGDVQEGMQAYAGEQLLGRIERVHGDGFDVAGVHYRRDTVDRIEHNRVYVTGSGRAESAAGGAMSSSARNITTPTANAEGEVRVPVVEEELQVGKREVDLGEVEIRRRVVEEERMVPVTLRREEVTVEQVGTPERPLQSGEEGFQEGTIRVPVHGEEAVVAKEAVVTGEVVVNKGVTEEQRQVSDTVRRTEVDFDENSQRGARSSDITRTGAVGTGMTGTTDHTMTDATPGRADAIPQPRMGDDNPVETMSTVRSEESEQTNPHYQTGYRAGSDARYAGRSFEESEADLQSDHAASGSADSWEQLREQVRAGFGRARGQ